MANYLYTQQGCEPCAEAKELLREQGQAYREVPVDNPMVEMGIGILFQDKRVHVPLLVVESLGIYVLSVSLPRQWRRLVDLREQATDLVVAAE